MNASNASPDPKTQIPVPTDILPWNPPLDMAHPLSAFQEALILSVCSNGTHIVAAHFHRTVRLPGPIWVHVALPDGDEQRLILRMDQRISGVEKEAAILPVLAQLGLPVPTILAGPVVDPTQPTMGAITVLNVLPGQDLLGWSWDAPPPALELAMRLVLEGVQRLHELTEPLSHESISAHLPHITLQSELQGILARGGLWLDEPVFAEAINRLLPIVETIQIPLMFSSGDYNPGNFLFDGEKLTGFIDFPGACFEDPHVGMAKYWTYSWYPLDRAGIVERYLEQVHLSFAEFAPRLALRCLWTLQREIAVTGGENVLVDDEFESHADYRKRILALLERALNEIA
ncbi:MAG: aminoglycoside phosphotransferase family protein [Ktedonobacteraceae bacterium]